MRAMTYSANCNRQEMRSWRSNKPPSRLAEVSNQRPGCLQVFSDKSHDNWFVEDVMRRSVYLIVAGLLASLAPFVYGQSGDAQQELQQKLNSQFVLSKLTADKSDIIMAGSVLVLQKDGLLMDSIVTLLPPLNTYKKGKLSQGFGSGLLRGVGNVMVNPLSSTANYPERKFLAGEKFWVTSCALQADGIVFQFYSDPFAGIRYHGLLKFPFPKGQVPPADEALKTIAEVLTVDGNDSAVASSQAV